MTVKIVKKEKVIVSNGEGVEGTVEVEHPTGVKEINKKSVAEIKKVIVLDAPIANVGFKVGYTKNLGDYQSMRFDVSLYMPCEPDEIDDTFTTVKEWCDEELTAVVKEYEEAGK